MIDYVREITAKKTPLNVAAMDGLTVVLVLQSFRVLHHKTCANWKLLLNQLLSVLAMSMAILNSAEQPINYRNESPPW